MGTFKSETGEVVEMKVGETEAKNRLGLVLLEDERAEMPTLLHGVKIILDVQLLKILPR